MNLRSENAGYETADQNTPGLPQLFANVSRRRSRRSMLAIADPREKHQ